MLSQSSKNSGWFGERRRHVEASRKNRAGNSRSAEDKLFQRQLEIGSEVEKEHQASLGLSDAEVRQIAVDHLKEDPNYYSKLKKMESSFRK